MLHVCSMKRKNWRAWLADYFHFSVRERWAVLILVGLALLVKGLPNWLPVVLPALAVDHPPVIDSAQVQHLLAPGAANESRMAVASHPVERRSHPAELFLFDPNTISVEAWMKLGLDQRTAERIGRYRQKGGWFRRPADIRKIYGLSPELADKLQPFVRLSEAASGSGRLPVYVARYERAPMDAPQPWARRPTDFKSKPRQRPMVHINLADSTEWEALPGIGAVLAGRIVRFREKLGGFHAPAQLLDVFGLRDSTYQLIAPLLLADNLQWKRISINQASEAELSAHPYFRWKLARLIVAYRTAHGPFLQVEELKDIQLITDEVFEKMAPYCQLDDPHFKE